MNTIYYTNDSIKNKTHYSAKTTREIRDFLIRVKKIVETRNENPNTPEELLRPDFTYKEICDAIESLSEKRQYGMSLNERENQLLRETIHEADKIFHEYVINMHWYHIDLKNDIDRLNGGSGSTNISGAFLFRRQPLRTRNAETISLMPSLV